MIRPYLAVLKDSFREAFSSRVLWILLAITTLALLALAPAAIVEHVGWQVRRGDLLQVDAFLARIGAEGQAAEPTPGKRIWEGLSPSMQEKISHSAGASSFGDWTDRDVRDFLGELNGRLGSPDFYLAEAWASSPQNEEARDLLGEGIDRLDSFRLRRLNRLLIDAAFFEFVLPNNSVETAVDYAGQSLVDSLPGRKELLLRQALMFFVPLFAGTIGVFAAILVTASIVPQTYEAGAIDLLLSKPVSRSLLFLAKFFGGCAFTLINAAYLILGLYLILGVRHGYWNERLLLCVPVFMFLFAVYYGVSALAGVIWRNAIVSVVVTIVFWFVCMIVGVLKVSVMEFMVLNPDRITAMTAAGDGWLIANEAGEVQAWRSADASWVQALGQSNEGPQPPRFVPRPMVLGPVYLTESKTVTAYLPPFPGMNLLATPQPLQAAVRNDVDPAGVPDQGVPDQGVADWAQIEAINAPRDPKALFADGDGGLLAVAPTGIWRFKGDLRSQGKQEVRAFGVPLLSADKGPKFELVSEGVAFDANLAAALSSDGKRLAVYEPGRVYSFGTNADGRWTEVANRELESNEPGVVGLGGETIVLAAADGNIVQLDAATLETVAEFQPLGRNMPRSVEASPDGHWFAVVFHHRHAVLLDARAAVLDKRPVPSQGDISAAKFVAGDRLALADHFNRVIEYDLHDLTEVRRFQPSPSMFESIYWNVLGPIYTVFPKPGELQNLVVYLLTEEEAIVVGPNAQDPRAQRVKVNIYGPVWSNLGFLAAVLAISCLYVQRRDF